MKLVVTGSHGLIGGALVPALQRAGHTVVPLVRGPAGPGQVRWDPAAGDLDAGALAGIDGAVNLAGEGLADRRWTQSQKQRILDSRVRATTLLANRLVEAGGTGVLISGSAVGFYGDRGDEKLTEEAPGGSGYLADVVRQWEAATEPARHAGVRVVLIRTGIVLSPLGGALKRQLPLFRCSVGGRLGSGRQYQSWISLADEVGAIIHAATTESLSGPVNLTAPAPVTNAEFTRTLAAVLHRPALLPAPRLALSLVLGPELVDEALLASQRVLPEKLRRSGFVFEQPNLDGALRSLLGG
jgi:uncharacterized protein (TIGR01777 family)